MADVQNFQKRIEIQLNRSEVTNYLSSTSRTPAAEPDGTVTIKEEPRNENELLHVLSVIVKTESPDNPKEQVSSVHVKGFNCPTCHLTFKYRLHFKDHQSTNLKCAVQYNPKIEVKLDPDADTPNFNGQVKLVHSCPKCKKEFGKPSRLQHHITTVHSNEKPYVCSKCLHAFKELGNCDQHNRKEHKFNCEKCELSFVMKSSLEKHSRKVHLESPKYFSCHACKKVFARSSALKRHTAAVHSNERPYVCSKCLHAFKELGNCYRHNRQEHKFNCEKCELSFVMKSSLEEHARMVHLESSKYFSCHACKKEFVRSSTLKRHTASIHSNERPYVCSTCLHTFKELCHRDHHARKEHKVKCANCELSFVKKSSLQEHARKVHLKYQKYFSCPECKKTFPTATQVRLHMTVHSNARPYVCSACQKAFKWKAVLAKHTREVHSTKNSAEVMSHISSIDEAPDPSLGVTIKEEPRTEDDLSVIVKTESLHRPDQEICVNGKGFQCPACQLTFKYLLHLKHHHSTENGCTVQHNLIDHVKFENKYECP